MVTAALLTIAFGTALAAVPQTPKDFDKDGVADLVDDCPTDPGSLDNRGCPGSVEPTVDPAPPPQPKVRVSGNRIEIAEKVRFKTGSAQLATASRALLLEVAEAIAGLPKQRRVEVRGHTDARGSRGFNRRLSKRRADSVMRQLVANGVDARRLRTVGRGPDAPVASNATAAGRARNRRVEFIIVSEKP